MIDWASANRNRPPLDVCHLRRDGEPNTAWPSWYADDVEQAMRFVSGNHESHGAREYPLAQVYVVIDHATGDEVTRFTVADALAAKRARS